MLVRWQPSLLNAATVSFSCGITCPLWLWRSALGAAFDVCDTSWTEWLFVWRHQSATAPAAEAGTGRVPGILKSIPGTSNRQLWKLLCGNHSCKLRAGVHSRKLLAAGLVRHLGTVVDHHQRTDRLWRQQDNHHAHYKLKPYFKPTDTHQLLHRTSLYNKTMIITL